MSGKWSRRVMVRSAVFGVLTPAVPCVSFAKGVTGTTSPSPNELFHRYPAIDDGVVSEVVGASHFDLQRVRELVDPRPELARATWDWGFGDWETALGAASHVGRRDIAEYLLSQGARPDIFTFAMLGASDAVKAQLQAHPGIGRIAGPHGISLLQHARNGLRSGTADPDRADAHRELIAYLESLQPEDDREPPPRLTDDEQTAYLGDYRFGDGPTDGFRIQRNLRKRLAFGRFGTFGGSLYPVAEQTFAYNGCPSVTIRFEKDGQQVVSLTVDEPGLTLLARKVGDEVP